LEREKKHSIILIGVKVVKLLLLSYRSDRGGNQMSQVGFVFGWVGLGKFDQKNYQAIGRVLVNTIRVGSGRVSGQTLSGFFEFWVISGQIRLGFGFY
jgi:hypothetical protein